MLKKTVFANTPNAKELVDLQTNYREDYYRIVREVAAAIVERYKGRHWLPTLSLFDYRHEELIEPWAKTYEEAVAKNMTIDNTPGLWDYKLGVDAMAKCLWYTGSMPEHNLLIDHRPPALWAMGYDVYGNKTEVKK